MRFNVGAMASSFFLNCRARLRADASLFVRIKSTLDSTHLLLNVLRNNFLLHSESKEGEMLQGHRLVYVFSKKLWRSSVAMVVYAGMFLLGVEFPGWAAPVQSPHAGPSVDGSKVYDEKCAT